MVVFPQSRKCHDTRDSTLRMKRCRVADAGGGDDIGGDGDDGDVRVRSAEGEEVEWSRLAAVQSAVDVMNCTHIVLRVPGTLSPLLSPVCTLTPYKLNDLNASTLRVRPLSYRQRPRRFRI
jgi:hypothetical protein